MIAGLQVFDENGNLVVDNTSRLTLYLGVITLIKGVNNTATINDKRFANGKPFYVCTTMTSKGSVKVSFSGETMQCELVDALSKSNNYSVTLMYGVY